MKKEKAVMVWSGGKDSSMALHKILEEGKYDVAYLMCTVLEETNRVSMHGVRREIIQAQAEALGVPLQLTVIPAKGEQAYEKAMADQVKAFKQEGINFFIFGDIFLEDLRDYRIKRLAEVGAKAIFPLWQRKTDDLIQEFLELGFKTICCCASLEKLDSSLVGKTIDKDWLKQLGPEIDPCGENGEYHSCVYEGPVFTKKLDIEVLDYTQKSYKHEDKTYEYGFVDIQLLE